MPDTAITLPFAGADRRFWLTMPQIIEIERRADRSIFEIYEALGREEASLSEVHDIVSLGLERGASLASVIAPPSIESAPPHLFPVMPLAEGLQLAWRILHAAISGIRLRQTGNKASGKPKPFRKGQVLANCGSLHLDWQSLSLSGYFEAIECHTEASAPEGAKPPPSDWLRNAVKTWSGQGPRDPDRLRRFVDAHRTDRGEKLTAVMKARAE